MCFIIQNFHFITAKTIIFYMTNKKGKLTPKNLGWVHNHTANVNQQTNPSLQNQTKSFLNLSSNSRFFLMWKLTELSTSNYTRKADLDTFILVGSGEYNKSEKYYFPPSATDFYSVAINTEYWNEHLKHWTFNLPSKIDHLILKSYQCFKDHNFPLFPIWYPHSFTWHPIYQQNSLKIIARFRDQLFHMIKLVFFSKCPSPVI